MSRLERSAGDNVDDQNTRRFDAQEISRDLLNAKSFGSTSLVPAIRMVPIINASIDELHRQMNDTDSMNAHTLAEAYKDIKEWMDQGLIPKDAPWYPQLEKKMIALGVLHLGANFDKDFAEKAKKGFNEEAAKLAAWTKWLREKGIEDEEFLKLSTNEIATLDEQFDIWYKENK